VKDFFISYNQHDRGWAEWIAWTLEENEFSVVIQAWDFVGNWVMKMDSAMRESGRTIVVLSPHYVDAKFTQSEWADAFRRDPTGAMDLLIPVRVEPVEPQGVLGQIIYVDFVGKNEAEALELLLKRVRGARGKPSVSPQFPRSNAGKSDAQRSIAVKPVYPAEAEDQKRLLPAFHAIVRWRGLYSGEIDTLRAAGELARAWSEKVPTEFDDKVAEVIALAGGVAQDFRSLPIETLEFARPYGLAVHPTVFWGNAMEDVADSVKALAWEKSEENKRLNLRRAELGMKRDSLQLNRYGFEMIARVLESAVALARFNPDSLPRGFLKTGSSEKPKSDHKVCPTDLSAYGTLLMARIQEDPRLHLVSPGAEMEIIGSFAARTLKLFGLCAQKNRAGSIDLVAHDFQHLYYWQSSSPLPTMQFALNGIQDAHFLSPEPGAAVAAVDSDGVVSELTPEGGKKKIYTPTEKLYLEDARIWVDHLDQESWYALWLTRDGDVSSGSCAVSPVTRSADDLWQDPVFVAEFGRLGRKVVWQGLHRDLAFGTLSGLPCLIVTRTAYGGVGVCFLDPKSLVSIRRPIAIQKFVGEVALAGGRWLIAALLKNDNRPQNRLLVWDLDSDADTPIGGWFERSGDVYHITKVAETADSFQTVQVFRTLELHPHENYFQMIRFEWPSGKITEFQRLKDLRIWPVDC